MSRNFTAEPEQASLQNRIDQKETTRHRNPLDIITVFFTVKDQLDYIQDWPQYKTRAGRIIWQRQLLLWV